MKDNKILAKLQKYSPWTKINRFIISVVYIFVYLALTGKLLRSTK